MPMIILPLTYLGDTRHYSVLAGSERCVVDIGENYVKQTVRNRCEILTANGRASLTVNVAKGGSKTKRPVRDMRIDYSKRWQHQHWLSLVSAYRNSPYFDHLADLFAPYYERHFEFLADFNLRLMELSLRLMGQGMPVISEEYVEASAADVDLRTSPDIHYGPDGRPGYSPRPYHQVFSDRFAFEPCLSVIDLLMCEGTRAKEFLTGPL